MTPATTTPRWVIDTNWLLDLWVFNDPRAVPLRLAIEANEVQWLFCERMQAEWHRVLQYPAIAPRLTSLSNLNHLTHGIFDTHGQRCATPSRSVVRCTDADDQVFIDLALQEGAHLLSKDKAVLKTRRAMAKWGVLITPHWQL